MSRELFPSLQTTRHSGIAQGDPRLCELNICLAASLTVSLSVCVSLPVCLPVCLCACLPVCFLFLPSHTDMLIAKNHFLQLSFPCDRCSLSFRMRGETNSSSLRPSWDIPASCRTRRPQTLLRLSRNTGMIGGFCQDD